MSCANNTPDYGPVDVGPFEQSSRTGEPHEIVASFNLIRLRSGWLYSTILPFLSSSMSPAQLLQTQRAAVLYGPKDLRVDERPIWPPQHNQAQVAVRATGLCGSDRACRRYTHPCLLNVF